MNRQIAAQPLAKTESPVHDGVLQRRCACGQHTGGGECEECRKRGFRFQAKLALGRPGDAFEREADRVAESVAGGRFAPGRPVLRAAADTQGWEEAPAMVEAALRTPGHPVPPAVRSVMESRVGHDFSRVRVHTGDLASRSVRSVGALAYTVGSDVVFGAGQYAPETPAGQKLLAHELAHVVQQGHGVAVAVQRSIPGFFSAIVRTIFPIGFSDDTIRNYLKRLERTGKIEDDFDSDLKARQIVRERAKFGPLSTTIKTLLALEMLTGYVAGADESATIELFRAALPPERQAMRRAIGRDRLWGALGGRNRNVIEALTLEAGDLQDSVVMKRLRGLSESDLQDYERNAEVPDVKAEIDKLLRQKRHELGSYPEEERRRISVAGEFVKEAAEAFESDFKELEPVQQPTRSVPSIGGPDTYTTTTVVRERVEIPIPAGIKLEFESKIVGANRPGLKRIAAHMIADGKLRSQTTRSLGIQAAQKIFRFTRFDHRDTAPDGTPTSELVLIEELGALPPAADLEAQTWDVNQPRPDDLPPDTVKVRGFEIKRDKDWLVREWEAVVAALAKFPDSVLTEVAVIPFKRQPCREEELQGGICGPKPANPEAGRRQGGAVGTEAIILYNEAFEASPTRYGLSTVLVKVLAHEIGHQVDLGPLDQAFEANKKGTGGMQDLTAARSRSGISLGIEGTKAVHTDTPAAGGEFLEAAVKDGLVMTGAQVTSGSITKYASKDIREQFADLFSLYLTDPNLLQAIRPNVYRYFTKHFPKRS